MLSGALRYSLPSWPVIRWLTETSRPVSREIAIAQVSTLYSSLPIFYSAAMATLLCAGAIWWRHPEPLFTIWLALEVGTILFRIMLLNRDQRAAAQGRETSTDLYLAMTLLWAVTLGYGAAITTLSGDFAAAVVVNVATAAIAGGMSVRYFGAPRFVLAACTLALVPMAISGILAADPVLIVTAIQLPLVPYSMWQAAKRINAMMIATMEAEHENARRASHDELTGLLNRGGFMHAAAARSDYGATLLYIDLDGFKPVNDMHGHEAGDAVLREVAQRLGGVAGRHGQAARLGGDEFVLLLPMLGGAAAERFGHKVVETVTARDFALGEVEVRVGASVGVATMMPGEGIDEALRRADTALYAVKTRGGGAVRLAA